MSGIYAKYQVQNMLLFVYTATRKICVIFAVEGKGIRARDRARRRREEGSACKQAIVFAIPPTN